METLELSGIVVDLARREVRRDGETLGLTAMEVALLRYLAARAGEVVTQASLLEDVWGYHPDVETRAVANAVKRLRVKIERDPKEPAHLLTAFGVGYRLELGAGPPLEAGDAFVGRAGELAALAEALQGGAGLTTLTGPGGAGKTRLARRFADRAGRPVCFCELAEARTGEDALRLVAGALGVPLDAAGAARAERVGRALAGRGPLLLVLDNVEQVLAPAAALVERWRRRRGCW